MKQAFKQTGCQKRFALRATRGTASECCRLLLAHSGAELFAWHDTNDGTYAAALKRNFAGNYDTRDVLRVWLEDAVVHEQDEPILRSFYDNMAQKPAETIRLRLKTIVGTFLWCKVSLSVTLNAQGKPVRIVGALNDVDDAVTSRLMLEYHALYDTLTGIYNAQSFYTKGHSLLRAHPENTYAILRLDIARFKFINELYGMDEGDRLLCHVAAALERAVQNKGICGRINSDIFALCVAYEEMRDLPRLIAALTTEIQGLGPGCAVHVFFGICIVENRTAPINVLCDRAGLALLKVKGSLLKNYAFYDSALRAREISERTIENEMENALHSGQFEVFLQPKHSLLSGSPIGAEALVRWRHPVRGLLPPAEFVALFEKNGFIIELDEFVWETVFRLLRKWLDKGICPLPISLNVSRAHIYSPDFAKRTMALLQKYGVPPYLVELELTETTFVENQTSLYNSMRLLQEEGLNFSIDDFGSGYSSLNMLKNTSACILKLDREFLCATGDDAKAQAVVRHTISMANGLDMQVVAEGVETRAQAEFLASAGCLAAQGYYYSRPMPVEDFEKLMCYT